MIPMLSTDGLLAGSARTFSSVLSTRCSPATITARALPLSLTNGFVTKALPGTKIRESLGSSKQWLSPVVAGSFVRRVTILGGESSGKSTLAAALAEQYNTEWVPEYGRELWDLREGTLSYEDLLLIATEQVRREIQAARAPRAIEAGMLICDTSPLTTLLYCLDMFNQAEPELHALAKRTYDLVVLCAPDFAFVQDGTRRDDTFRTTQHSWYQNELAIRSIPYIVANGSIQERMHLISSARSASLLLP
jgi:HTH-type transcriptional regulator, transcriptional repressor of NAD biosynthesis genes